MEEIKREIIVKDVKVKDHPKVGPRAGVLDREGNWYNCLKRQAGNPETWNDIVSLKEGDRLELTYRVRTYKAQDGSEGTTNDIIGFERVIRGGDDSGADARQSSAASPLLSTQRDTGRDDIIARQSMTKVAGEIISAEIRAGMFSLEVGDPIEATIDGAKRLFRALKEQSW